MFSHALSIPVLLVLNIAENPKDTQSGRDLLWDFPKQLYPAAVLGNAGNEEIVYDLIGRALYSPVTEHFISRFEDGGNFYRYDGQRHNGYTVEEQDATWSTHLCGEKIYLPSSYRTETVLYRLRGGSKAQQQFYHHQIQQVEQKHHFTITGTENLRSAPLLSYADDILIRMHESDRSWMVNPYNNQTTEYISAPSATANDPGNRLTSSPEVSSPEESAEHFKCDGCEDNQATDTVECATCSHRSHVQCMELLGYTFPNDRDRDAWTCVRCSNNVNRAWDAKLCVYSLYYLYRNSRDYSTGRFLLFQTHRNSRFYAAQVKSSKLTEVILEWYPGNIYHLNERPEALLLTRTMRQCLETFKEDSFEYNKVRH